MQFISKHSLNLVGLFLFSTKKKVGRILHDFPNTGAAGTPYYTVKSEIKLSHPFDEILLTYYMMNT